MGKKSLTPGLSLAMLILGQLLICGPSPSTSMGMFGGGKGGGGGSGVAEILAAGLITRLLMEAGGGRNRGGGGGARYAFGGEFMHPLDHGMMGLHSMPHLDHHHHPLPPMPMMHPFPFHMPMGPPRFMMNHPLHSHQALASDLALDNADMLQAPSWHNQLHQPEHHEDALAELLLEEDALQAGASSLYLNPPLLDRRQSMEQPEFFDMAASGHESRYILPRIVRHFVQRLMRRAEHV